MFFLLMAVGFAQEPAYYSPDGIAQSSQVFRKYSEGLAPRFERLQNSLGRAGAGLGQLEQAVLLLGDRAPESMMLYLEQSRKTANHAFLVAQEHVGLVEADSQEVFEKAMARAIQKHSESRSLVECQSPQGLMNFGPSRGRSACEGSNLNREIAATMDQDEQLVQAVEEILGIDWPSLDFEPRPMQAVALNGGSTHIQINALAEAFVSEELARLSASLERDLVPVQAALESGEEAAKRTAIEEAQSIREAYNQSVAELGGILFAALERGLKKQPVLLCPNPPVFGGCPGEDVTRETVERLGSNRRFKRALP